MSLALLSRSYLRFHICIYISRNILEKLNLSLAPSFWGVSSSTLDISGFYLTLKQELQLVRQNVRFKCNTFFVSYYNLSYFMMKSALLLLFLLFGIASGNLLEQRNYGTWSKVQNPNADKPDLPARYFLCGFQFELTRWLRYYPCLCKKRWYRWRRRYRCLTCSGWQYTRTTALKAKYCHFSDWNKQKEMTYSSGSKDSANKWGPLTMCPENQYVSQASASLGYQFVDLGFNGLKIKCRALGGQQSSVKEYATAASWTAETAYSRGDFFTNFKVKALPEGYLSGIEFTSSPAPEITSITFDYKIPDFPNSSPITIASSTIENDGSQKLQQTLKLEKQLKKGWRFNISNSITEQFTIGKSVSIQIPYVNAEVQDQTTISKTQTVSWSKTNEYVVKFSQNLLVFVPPKSKVTLKEVAYMNEAEVPFTATVVFSNRDTGQTIEKKQISGTWIGTIIQRFYAKIDEEAIGS